MFSPKRYIRVFFFGIVLAETLHSERYIRTVTFGPLFWGWGWGWGWDLVGPRGRRANIKTDQEVLHTLICQVLMFAQYQRAPFDLDRRATLLRNRPKNVFHFRAYLQRLA